MVEAVGSTAVRVREHFGQRAEAVSKIVTTAGDFAAAIEKAGTVPSSAHVTQAQKLIRDLDSAGENFVIASLAAGINEDQIASNLQVIESASARVSALVAKM